MSDSSSGESGLTSPSVPLEIIIPAGASILVFLSLTIFLLRCANRARNARAQRLARSPSLCVFADRERNRKWLEELGNLKELGLNSTPNRKLNRSSCFERNSQGKDEFNNDASLPELPIRPRSAFLSGRETASSLHKARPNRKTWGRFSSLGPRIARPSRARPQIPEIHVTVDSTEDVLAFQRAWSETFERDIGLAVSGMLDKRTDASRSSTSLSHPPQNFRTHPSLTHQRLSSVPNLNVTIRAGPGLQFPMDALPPIKETREIWGSNSRSTSPNVDRGLSSGAPVLDSSQYLSPQSAAWGPDYDPLVSPSVLLPSPQPVAQSMSDSGSSSSGGSFTERASEHGYGSGASEDFEKLKNSSSVGDGSSYLLPSLSASTAAMSLCSAVLSGTSPSVAAPSSPAPDSSAVLSSPSSTSNSSLPVNSPFTSSTPFEPTLSLGLIFDPSFSSYSFAISPDIKAPDATNASALPTPFIPAVYTASAVPSASFAQVASQSSLFPSKPTSDGGVSLLAGATGKVQGSLVSISGLAGVELWIDDDVDLFYYSGSA